MTGVGPRRVAVALISAWHIVIIIRLIRLCVCVGIYRLQYNCARVVIRNAACNINIDVYR